MKRARYGMVILLGGVVGGCSDSTLTSATLADIVSGPDSYDGRHVQVTGVLRSFPEPLHYWIEDSQLNRVEVLYDEDLARWLGQSIQVRGRFSYDTGRGRRILVEDLVGDSTPAE